MGVKKPRITVGAAIIFDHEGRVLVGKRAGSGPVAHLWEFPGGKREQGESLEECVVRECEEELGVAVELGDLFERFTCEYPDRFIEFWCFYARSRHGRVKRRVHEELAWVKPPELPRYKFIPADKRLVKRLVGGVPALVAVVGGGAAGIVAAIAAAREGASVLVLEAGFRVGSTILRTGNGRCNYTNVSIADIGGADAYHNAEFAGKVLIGRGAEWTMRQFAELGVLPAPEKPGGRVYPRTYSAASVADCLLLELRHIGVTLFVHCEVQEIGSIPGGVFELRCRDGRTFRANAVVVAAGGGSRLLGQMGHRLALAQPVLCALATQAGLPKRLDGLRVRAHVRLIRNDKLVFAEEGEVLFRTYGVSGIVIFNASRYAQAGDLLELDLIPELSQDALAEELERRKRRMGWSPTKQLLEGLLAPAVADAVLTQARIPADLSAPELREHVLANALKHFTLAVQGRANTDFAQVTRGGAIVEEFEAQTLGSKVLPGLYAAGEALDVDGPCGGYNLQWAWASGDVAGLSAARWALGGDGTGR